MIFFNLASRLLQCAVALWHLRFADIVHYGHFIFLLIYCTGNYVYMIAAHVLYVLSVINFSEKEQHAKHLQDLEEDMETQIQKVEQRVRSEVTSLHHYLTSP